MHIQNTADNRSGYRVDLQNALVFGGLSAADWCVTFHILPGLEGGSLHRPDLIAGIPCVKVVHHVLQNDQHLVVLVNGVNAVVEGDEAAAQGREHHISVLVRPDVVPTKAAEVCL